MELNEIYERVAAEFAKRVDLLFESEDTLKVKFTELFPGLPFDRTSHWAGILWKLFRDCWMEAGPEVKAEPTGYDRDVVLKLLSRLLDYNLFTQVLLNLQSYACMAYQAKNAEEDIKGLQDSWKALVATYPGLKLDPFEAKAKMFKAPVASAQEDQFNHTLSVIKSLKIISAFTPQISFRVSPKGSTPALVDANNISTLGIGADKYLRVLPGLRAFYIHWVPGTGPQMAAFINDADPHFAAEGISYVFRSKSGGEILNQVLFSRNVAYRVFCAHDVQNDVCTVLPRMSSVLVVCEEQGTILKEAFYSIRNACPVVELSEGGRWPSSAIAS